VNDPVATAPRFCSQWLRYASDTCRSQFLIFHTTSTTLGSVLSGGLLPVQVYPSFYSTEFSQHPSVATGLLQNRWTRSLPLPVLYRQSAISSLVPERHQRIYLRRSPRRDVASEQRNGDQTHRHGGVSQRISRRHCEEQSSQQSC
jgi:hypothetical protein